MAKEIDYKKNINEYQKSIKTMKSFVEAVRHNPTEFVGYKGKKGHLNCFREIFQNSLDELIKDDSPCDHIWVEYYENDSMAVITDNGRGIPFDSMIRVFTQQFTSSNYKKKLFEYSSGAHGVGSKCTNSLSLRFNVISYLCDMYSPSGKPEAMIVEFEKGYPKTDPKPYPNKENFQGTRIEFVIDKEIMTDEIATCDDILNLISTLVPLSKIGAVVDYHAEPLKGENYDVHLVNNEGIVTFLNNDNFKQLIPPIVFQKNNGEMMANIAFTWDANGLDTNEVVYSFANMCVTVSNNSSHVDGFLDGVTTYFKNYMNKFILTDKSKFNTINADIKSGLKAVVSVFLLNPLFSGQAKEILSNPEIKPFIKNLLTEGLDEWCKNNSSQLDKLCKYFKEVGTLRSKTDNIKIQLNKSAVSVFNNLPLKYDKPSGKQHLELLIVEGDSALGPTLVARDHKRQGCVPIRGKFKNAMTCTKAQFFANEECKGLNAILNCGIGRNCDVSNCIFERIIFLTDSDIDGKHIKTLLLKTFLVYYRNLVEAGRVYTAIPPMYSTLLKNGEREYFFDNKDFVTYMFKSFSKENEVRTSDNKKMKNDDVIQLLTDNLDYFDTMNILADNHAMDPNVLEYIYSRIVKNENVKQIAKESKKKYPYLEIKQDNGVIVGDGLVNENVETAIFHSDMMKDCNEMISQYLENSDPNGYILNGNRVSLYQLMSALNVYQPKNLTRYKGLGEMNPKELAISTVHPDYNRTLIRYTTEDIENEINEIRRIDSNMKELLDDIDTDYEL